jgi:hypothetical protein
MLINGVRAFKPFKCGARSIFQTSGLSNDDEETVIDRFPIQTFFRNTFNFTSTKSPIAAAEVVLDGSLVGDLGFDPLGFARNKDELYLLREAEIKHSRIAMLAALGWPTSELYHYSISSYFGFPDLLAEVRKKNLLSRHDYQTRTS